jgi:hypothetical protein
MSNTISKTAAALIKSGDLYPIECGQMHKSGAAHYRGRVYIAEWGPCGTKARSEPGSEMKADEIRESSRRESQF